MPTALEDARAQVDRGLGRVPAEVPDDVPTIESLKARLGRALGRESQEPIAATSEVPTLESLRARIQAAKGLPPIPRRRPEAPGVTALDQGPYEPEVPIPQRKPEIRRLQPGEFIQNQDGSRSTERSITVTEQAINKGRPTNIPSLYSIGGEPREVPEEQAVRFALGTGETYPAFASVEEAVEAAKARSFSGGQLPMGLAGHRGGRPIPQGERARAAAFPPELSPSDRASPISDSVIAEGMAAVQNAEAAQIANEILRRNGLPAVGARVTVTLPDGEAAAGQVTDSFTESNAELGLEEDGIKIALDSGAVFEEFVGGLADRGIVIAPEAVLDPEAVAAEAATTAAPVPIPDPINANRQGLARSALHAVVQGAAGGVAGFPEQVGIGNQAGPRWIFEQFNKIDRGERPSLGMLATDTARVVEYFNGDEVIRQRLRQEIGGEIRPIADEPAYQLGQRIRESTAEAFPVAPEHEGRFPVQLGRGIGSTATFLGTGLVGRLLRLPALPVVAGTGAIANSAETFRDAIDKGASFEDAYQASRIAGVVGTSEAAPIVKLLDRLDDASGGQVRRLVIRAAQGGLEEGAQELFQSVAENLIASELVAYDPERGLFQGSGDAAGVGFTVGALMNFLASMLGAKMRRSPQQVTEETVREFTEHVVREGEGVSATPGRPAERGEPFQRPEAPSVPGVPTGEPPAAPDEPVVVRPGEGFGGRPIPPGPEAPPATLPDDIPRIVFRGSGRTERGEAYSGPAVPILGPGRYFAFSREEAETFGPEVEQTEFASKNPLVIRSDEEWRALTEAAGWQFPNPFSQSAEVVALQTEALQDVLRQRGHDAVVVIWDDTTQTDTDRFGNEVKTLRTVFGQPQAFQLDESRTITAAPPPEGPTFPRDEPGGVKPKPARRVPRTPAALESLLSEWERLRFARGVTPERKAEAQRLQQDAINRLEGVRQQLQQAEQEGRPVEGPVEFRLRTASGAEATFQLEPDVEAIEGIQKRLSGTKAVGKFFSRAPAGTAGLIVAQENPDLDAPQAQPGVDQTPPGVERTIETEHGTARIAFPDRLHERLFDLAEGKPDKAEARTLFGEFEGFVLERFTGPADVIALAREYREEVLGQAESAARHRGGKPEAAALVIDPDEQTRYLQRPTLASIRSRLDRALGRQAEQAATPAEIEAGVAQLETPAPLEAVPTEGTGERDAPVKAETAADVDVAAAVVDTEPTDAQKEVGNYQKGHVRFKGFDITIETPRGATRTGVGPDGVPWSVVMPAHYGYIKGTEGADQEQVDVYLGEQDRSEIAYVVDQIDPETGEFDEHKVLLAAGSIEDAEALYDGGFSDGSGPSRRGAITAMSLDQFRNWVESRAPQTALAYRKPPGAPQEPAGALGHRPIKRIPFSHAM